MEGNSTSPPLQPQEMERYMKKLQSHNNGSGWFFWIAGLSLINSLITLFGGKWAFLFSLGFSQMIDAFGSEFARQGLGNGLRILAFFVNLIGMAVIVLMGLMARKKKRWAYWVGMILYAFDALLQLLFKEWLGFGLHLFALFQIAMGLSACNWLIRNTMSQPNPAQPQRMMNEAPQPADPQA